MLKNLTIRKPSRRVCIGILAVCVIAGIVLGKTNMFSRHTAKLASAPVEIQAIRAVAQDTPVTSEFVGKVVSKNDLTIMSKVSGNITQKMVKGGDIVQAGQPLFQIDDKQYQSAIRAAQGTLMKDKATLYNTQRDLARYEMLGRENAVPQQMVDSYESQEEEQENVVETDEANLQEAQQNAQDTVIVSPVDGQIHVDDLSIGQFVSAGSTAMATVSSLDPIWVQYSISENEYIKLSDSGKQPLPDSFKTNLKLILSDGSTYPLTGSVEEVDKGISDTTGTMTFKASFDNPQHFLVPGMFAKIVATGEVRYGAILIPQQSVKEILDNSFVYVIGANDIIETRQVTLGPKVGNMVIVDKGLQAGEAVTVNDVDKVENGASVKPTFITADQLGGK